MRTCTHFRLLSLPLELRWIREADADTVTRARSLRSRFGVELSGSNIALALAWSLPKTNKMLLEFELQGLKRSADMIYRNG